MIEAIAHPTDFSPASVVAFAHALRLALRFRCRLYLLHVRHPGETEAWSAFPHVRETLARWGMLDANADAGEVEAQYGVTVRKVEIRHADAVGGIANFLHTHRPQLIVAASHGPEGRTAWLSGSVSQAIARETHVATLLLGPNARAFTDPRTGALTLHHVLVPIAHEPSPRRALLRLADLTAPLNAAWHPIHVGEQAPWALAPSGEPLAIQPLEGPVVETILQAAQDKHADLIAMATEGRDGFLDAFRGSTTEQVLRRAPCPLLALPA